MASEISYTVHLLPEPEGGFTVRVPALPAVVSYGIDEDDALRMAREAIELILEVMRDDGEEVPADVVPLVRVVSVAL
jgi:predicted RNase H-like HicB family nuclease